MEAEGTLLLCQARYTPELGSREPSAGFGSRLALWMAV